MGRRLILLVVIFLALATCAPASDPNWISYTTQNSKLSDDRIRAIAFDLQGRAWIGTISGVNLFNGEEWASYPSKEVNALAVDAQGRVWVATNDGLSVFDDKSWKTYNAENSDLHLDNIMAMTVDSNGRIWLGGRFGAVNPSVGVFDGTSFTKIESAETGIPSNTMISVITSDPQGRIWIGTYTGGVFVHDANRWRTVMSPKSDPDTINVGDVIEALAVDQAGRAWIGTGRGLSVYDGQAWTTYTPENSEMTFERVDAVTVDAYDRVWFPGFKGAASVLETDGTWKTFPPGEGAATDSFSNTNAMAVDPQGRIWIGNDAGLNVFTPPAAVASVARVVPTPMSHPPAPTPQKIISRTIGYATEYLPVPVLLVLALIIMLRRNASKPVRSVGVILLSLAGSVILGVDVVYYLFVWVTTMGYGNDDIEFLMFLIALLPLIVIICLAWVRPLESGVVLMVGGIILGIMRPELIISVSATPYLVAGIFFLVAGLLSRRKPQPHLNEEP